MFFFVAEEWIRWRRFDTSINTVPTEKMRNGDFSELLGPNQFFSGPRIVNDPATGQPFANNVIPANRLSPNGLALFRTLSGPDSRVHAGRQQQHHEQSESARHAEGHGSRRFQAEPEEQRVALGTAISIGSPSTPFQTTCPWRGPTGTARIRPSRASWTSTLRIEPDERVHVRLCARRGLHQRLP